MVARLTTNQEVVVSSTTSVIFFLPLREAWAGCFKICVEIKHAFGTDQNIEGLPVGLHRVWTSRDKYPVREHCLQTYPAPGITTPQTFRWRIAPAFKCQKVGRTVPHLPQAHRGLESSLRTPNHRDSSASVRRKVLGYGGTSLGFYRNPVEIGVHISGLTDNRSLFL